MTFMGLGDGGVTSWTASNGTRYIDVDAYLQVTDVATAEDQHPNLTVWSNQTFASGEHMVHICFRDAGPAGTGAPHVSHYYARFNVPT